MSNIGYIGHISCALCSFIRMKSPDEILSFCPPALAVASIEHISDLTHKWEPMFYRHNKTTINARNSLHDVSLNTHH